MLYYYKGVDMLFRKKPTTIGLCLGGGGARGFAHLGALKAFEEYGIKMSKSGVNHVFQSIHEKVEKLRKDSTK